MRRSSVILLAVGMVTLPAGISHANGHMSIKDAPAADCCTAEWGGLYLGASVGYSLVESNVSSEYSESGTYLGGLGDDVSLEGVTGTLVIGYDWKVSRDIVAGVFGEYTFGERDGAGYLFDPNLGPTRFDLDMDDQWAIGARIGLARSCCTLWYLTAGYTQARLNLNDPDDPLVADNFGTAEKDLHGYFVGGGVEQQIRDGFSLKLEYRYADYGSETLVSATGGGPCATVCEYRIDADTDEHAIRLGVAYKFGHRREMHEPIKPLK